MTAAPSRPPLALTLGEPAGVGLDIAISAWTRRKELDLPPFLFLGDAAAVQHRAEGLRLDVRVAAAEPEEAASIFDSAIPCWSGAPRIRVEPGQLSGDNALAVIASIRTAVELVQAGRVSAVVTSPIQKKILNAAGFPFPGHTEFLGALAAELFGVAARPVMMIAGPDLKVVPVTIHIPLADVPGTLTTALIVETATTVATDLSRRFGIANPRLAVSGLNPHAGEDGMLGSEDAAVIAPAVQALQAAGVDARGPLPADTMFHPEARASYDVAICMYHDQALIPIKTLAFDEGVNVTLGLPFIRTSPDHGTALSLAGTGKARATSLVAALRLAHDLARREQMA